MTVAGELEPLDDSDEENRPQQHETVRECLKETLSENVYKCIRSDCATKYLDGERSGPEPYEILETVGDWNKPSVWLVGCVPQGRVLAGLDCFFGNYLAW